MAISIAKLAIHLTAETTQLTTGFARAKSIVNNFANSMDHGTSKVTGFIQAAGNGHPAAAAAAAAIAAMVAAMAMATRTGIKFNSEMENLRVSFTAFIGDAKEAKSLLNDLQSFAKVTPFSLEGVSEAGRTLLSMGTDIKNVRAQTYMLGEVASATRQPINELAVLFGQVQNAGRLTGGELKQFNERGIMLLPQLAKNLGVADDAIRKMVEDGKISFADVTQALADLTTGSGKYVGQMSEQAKTLSGRWATLKDTFAEWMGMNTSMFMPVLAKMTEATSQFIETLMMGQRELARLSGMNIPKMKPPLTQAEREKEIRELAERTAEQQKLKDAQKAMEEQAKAAAEETKRQMDQMKQRGNN